MVDTHEEKIKKLKKVNFGNRDTEQDEDFNKVFINTSDYSNTLLPKHSIIVGRKGSGKTAIVHGMEMDFVKKFEMEIKISGKEIEFKTISSIFHGIINSVKDRVECRPVLTNMWFHAIITRLMLEVKTLEIKNTKKELKKDFSNVEKYLIKVGKNEKNFKSLTIDILNSINDSIHSLVGKNNPSKSLVDIISNYPIERLSYDEAFTSLQRILEHTNGYLITFDNIDRYFESHSDYYDGESNTATYLRYIFESLVYAVYDIRRSKIRNKVFIKALIPKDKFEPLQMRDSDKINQLVKYIQWNKSELEKFVSKRIAHSLNIKNDDNTLSTQLDRTWYKIFPVEVENLTVGQKENSFDYILRHTQYKPRDIQIYCENIIATAVSTKTPITSDLIRKKVAQHSPELVKYSLDEFGFEFPNLRYLLNLFKNKSNILSYEQVYEIIQQGIRNVRFLKQSTLNLGVTDDEKIEKILEFLYGYGLLGYSKESRKNNSKEYHFHYTDSYTMIITEKDLVIHPMFYEYLQIEADNNEIVGCCT